MNPYTRVLLITLTAMGLMLALDARAQINDMEDLAVSADRIPDFDTERILDYLPSAVGGTNADWETHGWTVIDITDTGDCPACSPDLADNSTDDGDDIDAAIALADGTGHVIYLPNGTYNLTTSGNDADISTSNTVLRCESPTNTHIILDVGIKIGIGQCDAGSIVCLGSSTRTTGSALTWTGGGDYGDSVLEVTDASTISAGDYIWVRETSTALCDIMDELRKDGSLNEMKKVASVDTVSTPNTITIEGYLYHDYLGNTCAGDDIIKATPLTQVGVENCHISRPGWIDNCTQTPYSTNTSTSGCNNEYNLAVSDVAEFWWVNNHVQYNADRLTMIEWSTRGYVEGNTFSDVDYVEFNTEGTNFKEASSEVIVENNIYDTMTVMSKIESGATAIIFAYNYDTGTTNWNTRGFMIHGGYSRSMLIEGNHVKNSIDCDRNWDRNGPYNTVYRNRTIRDADNFGMSIYHNAWDAGADPQPSCPTFNVIGNHFYQGDGGGDDTTNMDFDEPDLWISYNVFRDQMNVVPVSGTDCGEGTSCANEPGTNVNGSNDPITALTNVPDSFYRTEAPDWWCQESCTWAAETGIGAFGDDFDDPLCKLPAQIRAESGTCTALSGGPAPEPAPGNHTGVKF